MKKKFTFLIAAIAALMLITLPGMVKGQTPSDGTFIIDFYDETKLSSTNGTGLTNNNYSTFVIVPTGITNTDVVTGVSVTGTVQYGKNGGLTAGTGTAAGPNSHYVTFNIGSDYAVNKCTVYATAYESGRWLLNGDAADSGTLGTKGAKIANVTDPLIWDNLEGQTTLTFKKDDGNGGNQKRLTIYRIVCEYSTSGGGTTSDLAVSPESLNLDMHNNPNTGTVTYTTSSTGTINITPASPTSYFSYVHDSGNKTITVTPLAVTPSPQTITINQGADDTYDSGSVSFTVSIVNTTPATTTTISDSGITNTDVYTSAEAGSLSATVTETISEDPVDGATVTWSGNNDAVATINATTGAVTLVAAGSVTFTATYAGVANQYQGSYDTYEMTVTSSAPYVQPTEFEIGLNNTLFGTNYNGSVSNITDANPIIGSQDNVNVTYAGSGNHYVNNSQIRFYPNNKLTFEAPSGYNITEVVFTADGTWAATISANVGTYTSNTKTWTGSATSVIFTGSGTSRCDISKATISLEQQKELSSISLSGTYPTIFDKGDAFSSEGIVVTANYVDETSEDVTDYATFSGYDMSEVGDQTVTVSYGNKTATYTITVLETGTASNPYTVAQAKANTPSSGTSANVYIHGIVSKFEKANIISDGNNYRYYISDDGTTTNQLLVYKGKGLNNVTFSNADDLNVGDLVTIYGGLTTYNSTKEIASGNYIISVVRPGTGSDPATIVGTVVDFTIATDKNYKVASNTTLTVTGTLTNNGTAANLVIEDGGQLICSNPVAATVKKNITNASAKAGEKWYAISSSVHDDGETFETIDNVTNLTSGTYDMFCYDEPSNTWLNQKPSTTPSAAGFSTMMRGRGYIYRNTADKELAFTGQTNFGTVEYGDEYNYYLGWSCKEESLKGFNLVGNPYPHKIYKGVAFATTSGTTTDTLVTGYYALEGDGSWTAKTNSDVIDVNQAILVEATEYANGKNLQFKDRTNAPNAKSNNDNIMFTVENSAYSDIAYAWFDNGNGLKKIEHRNANIPMLYINQDGTDYAIAMMTDNTKSFGLNFKAKTMGTYTLSYKAEGNFDYLHIIDRLTGEDVDMLMDGKYSFVGSPQDNAGRFIVKLGYDNGSSTGSETFVYQNGNDIIVDGEGTLEVFDVTGRKVMTTDINGVETINGLNTGVYIFRVIGETLRTQKIVVR